jgi:hypothetical protein
MRSFLITGWQLLALLSEPRVAQSERGLQRPGGALTPCNS